jgi:hypothetical protein
MIQVQKPAHLDYCVLPAEQIKRRMRPGELVLDGYGDWWRVEDYCARSNWYRVRLDTDAPMLGGKDGTKASNEK